jgi:Flp pilus assembly protein TadG
MVVEGDSPSSAPTRQGHRAQSLVELALVLPTFMLITLGVVDLARVFYESIALQGAAEAGSMVALEWRRASAPATVSDADAAVRTAVKSATNPDVFPFLSIQDSDISMDLPWTAGSSYSITVTRTFRLMTPFLANVFAGNQGLTLTSTVRGRHNCPC